MYIIIIIMLYFHQNTDSIVFEPGLIHILPSDREIMVSYQIPGASLSKIQPETTILAVVSTAFNVRDVSIQH